MIYDITYIDMAKVFDKVSYSKLLYKLYYYGIRGNVHNLLASYLSNRTQCIKDNKMYSNYVTAYLWCSPRLCDRSLTIPYIHKRSS